MTTPTQPARTFVLIHGASHGGWCYDRVAAILQSQGHRVFALRGADCGEDDFSSARILSVSAGDAGL